MKIIRNIFILFFGLALFAGCDKYNPVYDGPTVVEFAPVSASVKKGTTAAPGVYNITVQLVGPQQSTATELDYTVDATSTGVSGTHYTIGGTAGKVTIPANASSATIPVTAIPANIATGTRTVVVNLLGNTSFAPSENYKKFTLTITQ